MNIDEVFAAALYTHRLGQGVTRAALAGRVTARGFSFQQSTIYKIEKGLRTVTLGEGSAIAAALGLELDDLTDGQDDSLDPMRRELGRLAASLAERTLALDELALEIVDGQAKLSELITLFDELGHYLTTEEDTPITAIEAYGEIANEPLFGFVSQNWRASVSKSDALRRLFEDRQFASASSLEEMEQVPTQQMAGARSFSTAGGDSNGKA